MPKRSNDGTAKLCNKFNPLDALSSIGYRPTPTMRAHMKIECIHCNLIINYFSVFDNNCLMSSTHCSGYC